MTKEWLFNQMFEKGRPLCDDTIAVAELFLKRKTVKRHVILNLLNGCNNSTDNRIKYLKKHGFIKSISRGNYILSKKRTQAAS